MTREHPQALGAGLLAGAVALAASWVPGFWYDEAASIAAARRPLGAMPRLLAHVDLVHSQYYFLLHLWSGVFGWSQFATRAPSAIASAVTAWCVWRLAARWSGRRAAWIATLLVITLPGIAWAAQQARPFALAAMWLALTAYLLPEGPHRPLEGPRATLRLMLIGPVAALAVWAELYTILAFPGLVLIAWRQRRLRPVVIILGVVAAAAAPFALAASRQREQLGGHPGFDLLHLPGTVLHASWFVGPHDGGTGVPLTGAGSYLTMAVVLALALLAWRRDAGLAGALWCAALLPPVVMFLAAMPTGALYSTRYFAFTLPFLALAAGVGAATLSAPTASAATIAAVLGSLPLLVAMRLPYGHAGQDYAATAAAVRAAHPGALVYDAPRARATQVAFPNDFAGIRDLTLGADASRTGSLFDSSVPLTRQRIRESGASTIMLLAWQPGKAGEQRMSSVIRSAGCSEHRRQIVAKVALTLFRCPPR